MSPHVGKNIRNNSKLRKRHNFGATVDKHVRTEFEHNDIEAAINTMVVPERNRIQHLIIYITYVTYNTFKYHMNQTII
jgi:hypothetical protein